MSKKLKIIFITLITQFLIFNAFGMKDNKNGNINNSISGPINNVPGEILALIANFYLGDFPDNRNDLKEQYKKFLNLRLINKKFRDSINKYFKHEEIWDNFDDYLFDLIKDKYLNPKDELYLAAKSGSKKYFKNLNIKKTKIDILETISFLQMVLNLDSKDHSKSVDIEIIKKFMPILININDVLKNFNRFELVKLNKLVQEINGHNDLKQSFINKKNRINKLRVLGKGISIIPSILNIIIFNSYFKQILVNTQIYSKDFIIYAIIYLSFSSNIKIKSTTGTIDPLIYLTNDKHFYNDFVKINNNENITSQIKKHLTPKNYIIMLTFIIVLYEKWAQ